MMLQVLPALTLLIATLIAILPFGAGETVRACFSFAPIIIAQYWSVRRPQLLPVALIFVCGLTIDVMTNGPIGFWALLLLATAAFARLEERVTGQTIGQTTAAGRAAVFAITMLAIAALAWASASLYRGIVLDGQPMLLAALVAIIAYPLLAILMMPIDRLWITPRLHLFERGS